MNIIWLVKTELKSFPSSQKYGKEKTLNFTAVCCLLHLLLLFALFSSAAHCNAWHFVSQTYRTGLLQATALCSRRYNSLWLQQPDCFCALLNLLLRTTSSCPFKGVPLHNFTGYPILIMNAISKLAPMHILFTIMSVWQVHNLRRCEAAICRTIKNNEKRKDHAFPKRKKKIPLCTLALHNSHQRGLTSLCFFALLFNELLWCRFNAFILVRPLLNTAESNNFNINKLFKSMGDASWKNKN